MFYYLTEKYHNFRVPYRVRHGSLPFEDFRLAGLGLISSVNKTLVSMGTPNIFFYLSYKRKGKYTFKMDSKIWYCIKDNKA
jgi:hypothetical protein